jgi:hypothetical protein
MIVFNSYGRNMLWTIENKCIDFLCLCGLHLIVVDQHKGMIWPKFFENSVFFVHDLVRFRKFAELSTKVIVFLI